MQAENFLKSRVYCIHPYPKEEFSLDVLNNSPGEETISSIRTKLEMAKDINLQMGEKIAVCKYKMFCHLLGQIQLKQLYGLLTYGPVGL